MINTLDIDNLLALGYLHEKLVADPGNTELQEMESNLLALLPTDLIPHWYRIKGETVETPNEGSK